MGNLLSKSQPLSVDQVANFLRLTEGGKRAANELSVRLHSSKCIVLGLKEYLHALGNQGNEVAKYYSFPPEHQRMLCSAKHNTLPDAGKDEACRGGQNCHISQHESLERLKASLQGDVTVHTSILLTALDTSCITALQWHFKSCCDYLAHCKAELCI